MKHALVSQLPGRFIIVALISLVIFPRGSFAVPAYDGLLELKQSSGMSFEARQRGDEWHNWVETNDGYGIYKNMKTANWEYYMPASDARFKNQAMIPGDNGTHAVVGEADPVVLGIPRGLRPPQTDGGRPEAHDPGSTLPPKGHVQTNSEGTFINAPKRDRIPLLVIGVDYTNVPATYAADQVQPLLFGSRDSVSDYYREVSYKSVTITPAAESQGTKKDGFIGWLRLRGNHPDTGSRIDGRNQQIAKDAILAADPYINYADYDTNNNGIIDTSELSVVVIVAGYERSTTLRSPSVWAHQWDMSSVGYPLVDGKIIQAYAQFGERHGDDGHLATFGVMAHELGHLMFGLPDLYDTDSSNGDSLGVGYFDLMGYGNWGALAGAYAGSSPTQLSAWSKEYLSWGAVTAISSDQGVTFPGSDRSNASVFRINTLNPNQYFLIENRELAGYDVGFQRHTGTSGHGGLVIYHIDRSRDSNADENDKMVDVEEANEGSLGYSMLDNREKPVDTTMFFFQGNTIRFTGSTTPDSRLKNGDLTNISITDISAYGDEMSARVSLTLLSTPTPTPVPDTITAVSLLSFTGEAGGDGVVTLTWETATEVDNAGFNLYRAKLRNGNYTKINNTLIASQGDGANGASYRYEDAPGRGTFYYKLEDVDYNGVSTMHGPEKVRVRSGENAARR